MDTKQPVSIKENPDLEGDPDHRGHLLCALSGDDIKAFEAGCDAYICQAFQYPRELLAKIREYRALSKSMPPVCREGFFHEPIRKGGAPIGGDLDNNA